MQTYKSKALTDFLYKVPKSNAIKSLIFSSFTISPLLYIIWKTKKNIFSFDCTRLAVNIAQARFYKRNAWDLHSLCSHDEKVVHIKWDDGLKNNNSNYSLFLMIDHTLSSGLNSFNLSVSSSNSWSNNSSSYASLYNLLIYHGTKDLHFTSK